MLLTTLSEKETRVQSKTQLLSICAAKTVTTSINGKKRFVTDRVETTRLERQS